MRVHAISLAALLVGCAAEFTEPWEVTEPRLMGARVEVEGASERPRPRINERFALRQYIALPGPLETPLASRYSIDVALCLGFKAPSGELVCLSEQELDPAVTVVSETEILISGLGLDLASIELPPELPSGLDPNMLAELAGLDRLVLFGALCVDGRVERVAEKSIDDHPPSELFRCVDNATSPFPDASTFTISVILDRDRRPLDENRNPSFECEAPDSACALGVERAGEPRVPGAFVVAKPPIPGSDLREVVPWPARDPNLPLPWNGCASDPSLLQVATGSGEHTLRARFDPSDRELYQYEIESTGVIEVRTDRESLLLSHALTRGGGELDRYFSKLYPEEPDAEAEISFTYTPPKQSAEGELRVPENGRLVRFYFTLRDERGGLDFTTRELCLVPGA